MHGDIHKLCKYKNLIRYINTDLKYAVNLTRNNFFALKIRSLYPRRVDMWYEDFQGGVEQGHLNLGQVGTNNSIIVCMYVCMYTCIQYVYQYFNYFCV